MDTEDAVSDLEGGNASSVEDGLAPSDGSVCRDSDDDGQASLPSSKDDLCLSEHPYEGGSLEEDCPPDLDDAFVEAALPESSSVEKLVSELVSLSRLLPRLWTEGLLEGPEPCMNGFASFVQSVGVDGCVLLGGRGGDPERLEQGLCALRLLRKELCRRGLCSPPRPLSQGGDRDAWTGQLQEEAAFLLQVVAVERTKAFVKKLKTEPRKEEAWIASLRLEDQISSWQQNRGCVERFLEIMKPTAKELERLGLSSNRRSLQESWLEQGREGEVLEALRTWRCLRFTGVPSFRSLGWALASADKGALQGTRLEEPRELAGLVADCWELMGLTREEKELLGCEKVTEDLAAGWLSRGTISSHLSDWARARFL